MRFLISLHLLCACIQLSHATPAPDFTVTTSDGALRRLYSDYIQQQKVVVIEAFFTTCPPCNTHAPHWQTLYQNMLAAWPGRVEFLMLSTQNFDINTSVATYKTTKGLTMPGVGSDGGSISALNPYTSGQFGDFLGTPTFIVIAPGTGEVTFDIRGTSPSNTMTLLSQKIASLLTPPPPPPCVVKGFGNNTGLAASVRVRTTTNFDTTIQTSANGQYALSGIRSLRNATYTLTPGGIREDHLAGVTTADLALISKNVIGLDTFRCAWQRLAADANCSVTITPLDIVALRRLILGIDDTLRCGSRKFLPAMANGQNGTCVDFEGIKSGDLHQTTCTARPSGGDRGTVPDLQLQTPLQQRVLQAGEMLHLPVYASNAHALASLQIAWTYNHQLIDFQGIHSDILPEFSSDFYHVAPETGNLRMAWFHSVGTDIAPQTPLFTLSFLVKKPCVAAEVLQWNNEQKNIPSEMSTPSGATGAVRWQTYTTVEHGSPLSIAPNPTADWFDLHFDANAESAAHVQVYNALGKLCFESQETALPGHNVFRVRLHDAAAGLYVVGVNGKNWTRLVVRRNK
jgi:hypothetical protein